MRRSRFLLLAALLAAAPLAAAERRPRILLSNDDGITAAGLHALYAELAKLGEVTVAAPADNQSGVGHGITYQDPIRMAVVTPLVAVEGATGPWYRIVARPATCVRLALSSLLPEKPDLVVSGINRGENAGLVMYVSGTVGAAREAAFDGIPAIAASQVISKEMDYRPGAAVVARVAAETLRRGLPAGTLLNVNIPAGEIRGIRIVPHAFVEGANAYERRESPRGETYFWNVWEEPVDPGGDTDVGVIGRGFVAVTPVRIDANDPATRKALESWELR
jgi:5'-nucleotidase